MSKQEVIICQNFNTELSQKLSAHSYDKIFILTDEHTFRLCLPLLQDIALLKDAEQIVIGPEDLSQKLSAHSYDKIFILTDEHTFRLCLPLLQDIALLKDAEQIVIGPEDVHKNLETLAYVWNQLSNRGATRHSLLINLGGGMVTDLGGFAAATVWNQLSNRGATRHSLLINLGGGMVTDLGGFAAATFKRGIACINIPTTLLSMIDAAVGGKTGINFNGLKNEIGSFYPADQVMIDSQFLKTLDMPNLLSGCCSRRKNRYQLQRTQE